MKVLTFPYIYQSFQQRKEKKQDGEKPRTLALIYVWCMSKWPPVYTQVMFLLKKSQLTSLFIQHNQSPDTSIFTLHSSNGSKVEKRVKREKREKEKSVRGQLALEMENEGGPKEKRERLWWEYRGWGGPGRRGSPVDCTSGSQGRERDVAQSSGGGAGDRAWHGVGIHILHSICMLYLENKNAYSFCNTNHKKQNFQIC